MTMNQWITRLRQSSLAAMFGVVPSGLWYGVIALALLMAGGWINEQRWQAKYQRHVNEHQTTSQAVKDAQAMDNQVATVGYITFEHQQKTETLERREEVKVYEQQSKTKNDQASRLCAAHDGLDDEFVRVYNQASTNVPAAAD
jgi:FtsZ-interacting cell division protein ZipA